MLSEETLNRYRQMPRGERFALVLRMMKENFPAMYEGKPEVVRRRFELLRRQNDERNKCLLEGLAQTLQGTNERPHRCPVEGR